MLIDNFVRNIRYFGIAFEAELCYNVSRGVYRHGYNAPREVYRKSIFAAEGVTLSGFSSENATVNGWLSGESRLSGAEGESSNANLSGKRTEQNIPSLDEAKGKLLCFFQNCLYANALFQAVFLF